MVQISSVRDISHLHKHIVNHDDTSPKMFPHLNPSRQRPKETIRQVSVSKEPTPIDYQASVANRGYDETKKACDQIHADTLLYSQLQNEEQDNTLEQRVDEIVRKREQKTKANKT